VTATTREIDVNKTRSPAFVWLASIRTWLRANESAPQKEHRRTAGITSVQELLEQLWDRRHQTDRQRSCDGTASSTMTVFRCLLLDMRPWGMSATSQPLNNARLQRPVSGVRAPRIQRTPPMHTQACATCQNAASIDAYRRTNRTVSQHRGVIATIRPVGRPGTRETNR